MGVEENEGRRKEERESGREGRWETEMERNVEERGKVREGEGEREGR